MKKKIENPKIFISYAWGDKEYQDLVLSFASQLAGDGVDVVIDKWDLSEGNDTYAFMEKCVTDSTITNVLILLDPLYAKKANEREGGVGTETQIISAQIYGKVDQDKFIPVIMKREEDGSVHKPAYLEGRLHFDLSKPEKYDDEYRRIVKSLYGEETYPKPEIGKKPDWVSQPAAPTHKSVISFSVLKGSEPKAVKLVEFERFLSVISKRIIEFLNGPENVMQLAEYIELYDSYAPIRDEYLLLLEHSLFIENSVKHLADFLEENVNAVYYQNGLRKEIVRIRIHEMFIYTIAFFLKIKDYDSAGYLLNRTYFSVGGYNSEPLGESYEMFYSGSYILQLDKAMSIRDNKQYCSGTAQHWLDTLASDFCTKEQLILADLICFNISFYCDDSNRRKWFPLLYVYDSEFNSVIANVGKKMISKEFVTDILPLFGVETIEELKELFREVENAPRGKYRDFRYNLAFESARLLGESIKSDQIGHLR